MHLRVVDVVPKSHLNRGHIGLVGIGGDLRTTNDPLANVQSEIGCPSGIAPADKIGNAELGIGVQCNPSPSIAPSSSLLFRRGILLWLLRIAKFRRIEFGALYTANLTMKVGSAGTAHVLK